MSTHPLEPPRPNLLGTFARHPVAPNLIMAMMLLAGAWGLVGLNKQFFPTFALDFVSVRVAWSGASAEDVEGSITGPLERELRSLDGLHRMYSTSREGGSSITLEYQEGTDMGVALDQVKERIGLVRNLPAAAEAPEVSRVVRYEPVVSVLVTGPDDLRQLRPLVRRIERELLARGIDKVAVNGLPQEEIAIQVSSITLRELGVSLDDLGERIGSLSRDTPAGTIGRNDVARQLRALDQKRSELGFQRLTVLNDEAGRRLALEDIATIERRPLPGQTRVLFRGRPAVELELQRTETGDSLDAAGIFQRWLAETRGTLPAGVELLVYDEAWSLIKDRIMLLVRNGIGGLVLVVSILFLFLNGRVAWWVAVGIPVSFMAALGILNAAGGSINMVSLFALIMTLGIIVDDAIVVGEDALAHYQAGERPESAAQGGAQRMLAPVISSSLTTIAAFVPLMMIGGIIGNILFDIPVIVICVIAASLVESFLVLPGHLRGSFAKLHRRPASRLRTRLDGAFEAFRDGPFRSLVAFAVDNTAIVFATGLSALLIAVGLVSGGRIPFNFFPSPESSALRANVGFVSGTSPERVREYMLELDEALRDAESTFSERLVDVSVVRLAEQGQDRGRKSGDQFASLAVELRESDHRTVRNAEFIAAWKERIRTVPGLESFSITERRAGPPGRDAEVRLAGRDAGVLKQAALELSGALRNVPGVTSVEDDMPFGPAQLVFELTPLGRALGLTVESVGRQLRAAYDGHVVQIFQDGEDEVEVRITLPDRERRRIASLDELGMVTPSGETVSLGNVVELRPRRGFELLKHTDGLLSVQVSADVDPAVTTSNTVNAILLDDLLPKLEQAYGVAFSLEGRAAEQRETLGDMRYGVIYAGAMIYLVLAWVFGSYGWPLVVMATVPFGLCGALYGHWAMGIDLTILSLFGLFGLSGIVVNDSIILVTFYKELRGRGIPTREAIISAACLRLRAVLLTSLTTIAGLTPLLFETSLQAQFLIPMAVSISFGLGFATLLVLLFMPSLLSAHETLAERFKAPPDSSPATAD